MSNQDRFIVVNKQVLDTNIPENHMEILKDIETGVLYVYRRCANSGGLTVLVDAEGKPLTSF